jgi:methyl-accepting chemotaxis protein
MLIGKYLSSLRSTSLFMLCAGLVMGVLFPFYSAIFFGGRAFSPFYVLGCLGAGLLVGIFCSVIIREVLKLHLERQWQALNRIVGGEIERTAEEGDKLQLLLDGFELLLDRVSALVARVSSSVDEIAPYHRHLTELSRQIVDDNRRQAVKGEETLGSVEDMNRFFTELLKEIEALAVRTEERASISAEMSATTDAIAENIKEYSSSVMETSASIEEIAFSIKETTENIEALADSTAQTSGSIHEIGAAIVEVRDNTRKTADCSEKVRVQALEGMAAMTATIAAMMEIEQSSNSSFSAIQQLSRHTARVGEFLNIIKDVVEQTNLLSLNASIIAAQAGEHGRSFAVVAEEVRALARRTAASTREIEELVKDIQKETAAVEFAVAQGKEKVAEGVRISTGADGTLHRIEESAAEASRMVQKIATATDEQASGSRLITEEAEKNLERVKQVTKAFQEQEQGINLIVKALEQMRGFSQKITTSTQEQARGNRLYLKSVMEDNDEVKKLRDMCVQQIMMGDVLLNFIREAGTLSEACSRDANQIMTEVETLASLTEQVQTELAPFMPRRPEP